MRSVTAHFFSPSMALNTGLLSPRMVKFPKEYLRRGVRLSSVCVLGRSLRNMHAVCAERVH